MIRRKHVEDQILPALKFVAGMVTESKIGFIAKEAGIEPETVARILDGRCKWPANYTVTAILDYFDHDHESARKAYADRHKNSPAMRLFRERLKRPRLTHRSRRRQPVTAAYRRNPSRASNVLAA